MRVICTIGQSYFVRRAKQFSILPLDKQPIQSDAKPNSMTALSRFHKQARQKNMHIPNHEELQHCPMHTTQTGKP